MMRARSAGEAHDPWRRWSVLALVGLAVAAALVGFVWLPSATGDFGTPGLWASICRAAGVPQAWGSRGVLPAALPSERTTTVVLDAAMAHPASADAAGAGSTLALQHCSMCHGARGITASNAPSLAGQRAEVVVKQLTDYQRGDRPSSIMQAMAAGLSERDVLGLAAYYAALPKASTPPGRGDDVPPTLVRVGDPMRNIAPCSACHGAAHKLGAPWLEGMPKDYLAAQLTAFASGTRKNDSHAQMRNMARRLSNGEMAELAGFYAAQ